MAENLLLAYAEKESRDRLFMRVGRALNQWNLVEEYTCLLFHRLMLGRAYAISAAGFYSLTAFNTRLTMMNEAANWYFRYSGFESEYGHLTRSLERLARRRNAIAHAICYNRLEGFLPVGYLDRKAGDFKLMFREITQNRDHSLGIPDIEDCEFDCLLMGTWLFDFMSRTEPWHTWLSRRPSQHLDRVARRNRPPTPPSQTPRVAGFLPPPESFRA